jgi:hypothetical protein
LSRNLIMVHSQKTDPILPEVTYEKLQTASHDMKFRVKRWRRGYSVAK